MTGPKLTKTEQAGAASVAAKTLQAPVAVS